MRLGHMWLLISGRVARVTQHFPSRRLTWSAMVDAFPVVLVRECPVRRLIFARPSLTPERGWYRYCEAVSGSMSMTWNQSCPLCMINLPLRWIGSHKSWATLISQRDASSPEYWRKSARVPLRRQITGVCGTSLPGVMACKARASFEILSGGAEYNRTCCESISRVRRLGVATGLLSPGTGSFWFSDVFFFFLNCFKDGKEKGMLLVGF